jgi:predicted enzyme related to lactoylglutathione lyase
MANPVVHFEITGRDPTALRGYFGELFGWQFDTSGQVSDQVSEPDDYGFTTSSQAANGAGIPGGIGGGQHYPPQALFYVGVDDVENALTRAESLGGRRVLGPATAPTGLVIGHFTDPEGNLVGVASVPG